MDRTVRRPAKLAGTVTPPGDKSISHRSLMLNSMAAGGGIRFGLGEWGGRGLHHALPEAVGGFH